MNFRWLPLCCWYDQVVKGEWMVQCLKQKRLMAVDNYELISDDIAAMAPSSSEKAGREESEAGGGEPPLASSSLADLAGRWEDLGEGEDGDKSVFYYRCAAGNVSSEEGALFDLDGTLITATAGEL